MGPPFDISKTLLVGVCNLTPDSFSGDGWLRDVGNEYQDASTTNGIRLRLMDLVTQGASIIDIGAESTSPDSSEITEEEELARLRLVLPVVKELTATQPDLCSFSIDTTNAGTAAAAMEHGFTIVNDVSGGRKDRNMFNLLASRPSVRYIMMYCKNESGRADHQDNQDEVFPKMMCFFEHQIAEATRCGMQRDQLILDPGMGAFVSMRPQHSVEILKRIPEIRSRFNLPVLVGASRKGFLKSLVKRDFGPGNRLGASLAAALFAAEQGVDYLRVHDVMATRHLLDAYTALKTS